MTYHVYGLWAVMAGIPIINLSGYDSALLHDGLFNYKEDG